MCSNLCTVWDRNAFPEPRSTAQGDYSKPRRIEIAFLKEKIFFIFCKEEKIFLENLVFNVFK